MPKRIAKTITKDLYSIDITNHIYYPEKFPKYLPKRNDSKYYIFQFSEIDLTNTVAYEMLIRTKQYKKLISVDISKRDTKWQDEIQELGLNPEYVKDLYNKDIQVWNLTKGQNFYFDKYILRLKDIHKGLEKCIEYYIEEKKIYIKRKAIKKTVKMGIKKTEFTYKQVENISTKEILNDISKYYIPTLYLDNEFNFNEDYKMRELNNDLPLNILDNNFLLSIDSTIKTTKNIKVVPAYRRPLLKLPESNMIDLELNLDLPEEELSSFVKMLKREYNNLKIIEKDYKLDITNDYNSNSSHLNKKNKFKQIADMFYCFDYYSKRVKYVKQRNIKILKLNEQNSMLQEKIKELDLLKKEKKHINKPRIKALEKEILYETKKTKAIPSIEKNKRYIFDEKYFQYSKINPNTAQDYYYRIAPYIENYEYKELILGKKSL